MDEECVFCKIIKGKLPSAKVYEDAQVVAFLDIAPVNKGHTLVVPKDHYENIFEVPEEVLAKIIKVTKLLSKAVQQAVEADGITLHQANGSAAGQVIMHFHIHIMPRYENDNAGLTWNHKSYKENEAAEYAEKIKNALKSQH
jgi:histidine triad (HIT) family protein